MTLLKKLLIAIITFTALPYGDSFDRAVKFVLAHETATYHQDKGGPCKYGICQKWNPDINVKYLTEERAIKILRERYWDACDCELLDSNMALVVFDGAVMSGQKTIKIWSKNVYDAKILWEIRRHKLCVWIKTHPEDAQYIEGWWTRFDDLKEMIQ